MAEATQGAKASIAGASFQRQIGDLLSNEAGLSIDGSCQTLAQFQKLISGGDLFMTGWFAAKLVVGVCTFGDPHILPYVCYRRGWPEAMGVECMSQDVSGSARDKLAKKVLDLQRSLLPSVLILDGEHLTSHLGIRKFVEESCNIQPASGRILRAFFGLATFRRWVLDGLLWPDDGQESIGLRS